MLINANCFKALSPSVCLRVGWGGLSARGQRASEIRKVSVCRRSLSEGAEEKLDTMVQETKPRWIGFSSIKAFGSGKQILFRERKTL